MTETGRAPRRRDALDPLPSYKPGRAPKPASDRPTYKLSSNETPFPPLPQIVEAIAAASAGVNRYPDPTTGGLVGRLAQRLNVPTDNLLMGTGSVAVLYQLLQTYCGPGDEVVYAWRSFEAYPIAVGITGATPVEVPLAPGARHDLDAMAAAITDRTKVVLVCSPNNPTGPVVHHGELVRFVDRLPTDVLVVVDEAYVQFIRDTEAADGLALYRERPNVCVLRTFSKAYGLANLRVGFAVAPQPVIGALGICSLPFGVSSVAEAAALAAVECEDVLLGRVDKVVAERDRVWARYAELGWRLPVSHANFVWLPLGADADRFAIACEAEGVVVRAFNGDGCRVTIGEPEANNLVLEVAERFELTSPPRW